MEVEYCAEHSEVVAKLASGEASIALLPEPFVTASKAKVENLTTALDVTQLWEDACKKEGKSGVLSMGCVVVRAEFAEQNPVQLDAFLAEYKASIEYVNANGEQAAQLIADYGIGRQRRDCQAGSACLQYRLYRWRYHEGFPGELL